MGRVKATGRGVFITGQEAAQRIGLDLRGARVAIQGFGNVGAHAAELFAAGGSLIVAVQDHTGSIVDPKGLDTTRLVTSMSGGVAGCEIGEPIGSEDFWDVPCDILIPAALEGSVTAGRAERTRAKLILEGANGPTTPEADLVLAARGVLVVPDVICNSGGVTVSYFEWVQDFSSYFWGEQEINLRLDRILIDAFNHIWTTAEHHRVSLRIATFAVACERILVARAARGLYP